MTQVAFVTGAGGQVGRALVATVPRGWTAVPADRERLDITDAMAVARAIESAQPALVINCAAYTRVDRAEAEPERAECVNAQGAENVARTAIVAGARVIHLSTDLVFDGAARVPYRPSDLPAPLSAYGRSKLAGERAVLGISPEALVIRTAWVYDRGGRNFVRAILARLSERDEVGVVADQVGTPTWATGLAQAIWRAAELPTLGGLHHWTDDGSASWYDLAVAIREDALATGVLTRAGRVVPITTEAYPLPARRPAYAVLDKTDTWAVLGTAPHWREQLRSMFRAVLQPSAR